MRYVIFVTIIFLILPLPKLKSQDFQTECGMPEIQESYSPPIHYKGKYITSSGTLRVLVIFVRFADDNETSENWPNPNVLPIWAQNFVNSAYSPTGNYYPGTVSDYFYHNSYGNLHIIGDVYYVTTDHNESYYHQLASGPPINPATARSAIEMEVFNKLDNSPYNVDFSQYDNWKRLGDYSNPSGTDGKLDMCWFITRNLHDNINTPFGIGHALLDCATHSRDGVSIQHGFPGSGVGMFEPHMYRAVNASGQPYGSYPVVNHVAHEMTHYFFGGNHFADVPKKITNTRYSSSFKSYVGGWRSVYSGYEKWRLGWLQPKTITVNGDNYNLYDLATTMNEPSGSQNGRLFKIDIPNSDQYYLIENRQWISPFEARYTVDSGPYGLLKPGIIIYHVIDDNDNVPSVKVQKADPDGRFKWKMVYHGPNNGSGIDDFIDKDVPDRENGYSETEWIFITGYLGQFWGAEWHPNISNPYGGGPYITTYSKGGVYETTDVNGDSLVMLQGKRYF